MASACVACQACESQMKAPGAAKSPAMTAAAWMSGSFSSAAQAAANPEYRVIDLHMCRIWEDRNDGFWLYVEQAAAESPQQPYRQRVYRVVNLDDGLVRSDVYELPGDPLRFAGAWRNSELLAGLDVTALLPRSGCSITMSFKDNHFSGGTEGTGCESSLRGAAFATSEVTLSPDRLESWDRGWKADGSQAWGATQGPYVFLRQPGA